MVIEVYGGFYAIALISLKSSYKKKKKIISYQFSNTEQPSLNFYTLRNGISASTHSLLQTCAVILQCITCYCVGDSHHVTNTSNSQQQFHPDIKRCVQTCPIMIISACTLKLPNQKVEQ